MLATWRALAHHETRCRQTGEGVSPVAVASTLAGTIVSHRARPGGQSHWLSRDRIAATNLPEDIDPLVVTVGMLPIGVVCRPQDHNGIVDDVTAVISVFGNTSWLISAGCAVATFLAAYFDGWSKEAALAQSLFVARRGAAFGDKSGERPFVDQLQETIDTYERLATYSTEPDGIFPRRSDKRSVVVDALAFHYAFADSPGRLGFLTRLAPEDDVPLFQATVAMLDAARDPWQFADDGDGDRAADLDPQLLSLTDQLIRIRMPKTILPPLL